MTGAAILAREMMTQNLVTLSPNLDVFEAINVLLKSASQVRRSSTPTEHL